MGSLRFWRVGCALLIMTQPNLVQGFQKTSNAITSQPVSAPFLGMALSVRSILSTHIPTSSPVLIRERSGTLRLTSRQIPSWEHAVWILLPLAWLAQVLHQGDSIASQSTFEYASAAGSLLIKYLLCGNPGAEFLKVLAAHFDLQIAEAITASDSEPEQAADRLLVTTDDVLNPERLRTTALDAIRELSEKSDGLPAIYFVSPPDGNTLFASSSRRSAFLWSEARNALYFSYRAIENLVALGEDPEEVVRQLTEHAYAHLRDTDFGLQKNIAAHEQLIRASEQALIELNLEENGDYAFDQLRANTRQLTEGVQIERARKPLWQTAAYTELRMPGSFVSNAREAAPEESDAMTRRRVAWMKSQVTGHTENGIPLAKALKEKGWTLRFVYQPLSPLARCAFNHPIEWGFYWIQPETRRRIILGSDEMMNPSFGLLTKAQLERLKRKQHDRTRRLNRDTLLLPTFFDILRTPHVLAALLETPDISQDPILRLQLLGFSRLALDDRRYPLSRLTVFTQSASLAGQAPAPLTPEAMLRLIQLLRRLFDAKKIILPERKRIPTALQILVARMAMAQRILLAGSSAGWDDLARPVAEALRELGAFHRRVGMLGRWIRILRDPYRPSGIGKTEKEHHVFLSVGSMGAAGGRALGVLASQLDIDLSQIDYLHVDISQAMGVAGTTWLKKENVPFRSVQSHIGDVRHGFPFLKDNSVDATETGVLGSLSSPREIARVLFEFNRVLDTNGSFCILSHADLPRAVRDALRAFGFEILSEPDPRLSLTRAGLTNVTDGSAARKERLKARFGGSYLILVKTHRLDATAQTAILENTTLLRTLAAFADIRHRTVEDPEAIAAQPTEESLLPLRYDRLGPDGIALSSISRDEMRDNPRYENFELYLACLLFEREEGRMRQAEIPLLTKLVLTWDSPSELVLSREAVDWVMTRVHEEPFIPVIRENRAGGQAAPAHEDLEELPSAAPKKRPTGPTVFELFMKIPETTRTEIIHRLRPISDENAFSPQLAALKAILPPALYSLLTPAIIDEWIQSGDPERVRIFLQTPGIPLTSDQLGQTLAVCNLSYIQTTSSQRQYLIKAAQLWAAKLLDSLEFDWQAFDAFNDQIQSVLGIDLDPASRQLASDFQKKTNGRPAAAVRLLRSINKTLARGALQLDLVEDEKGRIGVKLLVRDPLRTQRYTIVDRNISYDRTVVLETEGVSDDNLSAFGNSDVIDVFENPKLASYAAFRLIKTIWPQWERALKKSERENAKGARSRRDFNTLELRRDVHRWTILELTSLDQNGLANLMITVHRLQHTLAAALSRLGYRAYESAHSAEILDNVDAPLEGFRRRYVRPENHYLGELEKLGTIIIQKHDKPNYQNLYLLRSLYAELLTIHELEDQAPGYVALRLQNLLPAIDGGSLANNLAGDLALLYLFARELGVPAPRQEEWRRPDSMLDYFQRASRVVVEAVEENPQALKEWAGNIQAAIYTSRITVNDAGQVVVFESAGDALSLNDQKIHSESRNQAARSRLAPLVPGDALEHVLEACLNAASPRDLGHVLEQSIVSVMTPSFVRDIFRVIGHEVELAYGFPDINELPKFRALDPYLQNIVQNQGLTQDNFDRLASAIAQYIGVPLPQSLLITAERAIAASDRSEEKQRQTIVFLRELMRDYFAWRGFVISGDILPDINLGWAPILALQCERVIVEGIEGSFQIYVSPSKIANQPLTFVTHSRLGYGVTFTGNLDESMKQMRKFAVGFANSLDSFQRSTRLSKQVGVALGTWWRLIPDTHSGDIFRKAFADIPSRAILAARLMVPHQFYDLTDVHVTEELYKSFLDAYLTTKTENVLESVAWMGHFGMLTNLLDDTQEVLATMMVGILARAGDKTFQSNFGVINIGEWKLLADLWTIGLGQPAPDINLVQTKDAQYIWLLRLSSALLLHDSASLKEMIVRILTTRYRLYFKDASKATMRPFYTADSDSQKHSSLTGATTPNEDSPPKFGAAERLVLREKVRDVISALQASIPNSKAWNPSDGILDRCIDDPTDELIKEVFRNIGLPAAPAGATAILSNTFKLLTSIPIAPKNEAIDPRLIQLLEMMVGFLDPKKPWDAKAFNTMRDGFENFLPQGLPEPVRSAADAVFQANAVDRPRCLVTFVQQLNLYSFSPSGFIIDPILSPEIGSGHWNQYRILEVHDIWTIAGDRNSVAIYRLYGDALHQTEDGIAWKPSVGLMASNEFTDAWVNALFQISESGLANVKTIRDLFTQLRKDGVTKKQIEETLFNMEVQTRLIEEAGRSWIVGAAFFQPQSMLEDAWEAIIHVQSSDAKSPHSNFPVRTWAKLVALSEAADAEAWISLSWSMDEILRLNGVTRSENALFWFALSQYLPARVPKETITRWLATLTSDRGPIASMGKLIPTISADEWHEAAKKCLASGFIFAAHIESRNHLEKVVSPVQPAKIGRPARIESSHGQKSYTVDETLVLFHAAVNALHRHKIDKEMIKAWINAPDRLAKSFANKGFALAAGFKFSTLIEVLKKTTLTPSPSVRLSATAA